MGVMRNRTVRLFIVIVLVAIGVGVGLGTISVPKRDSILPAPFETTEEDAINTPPQEHQSRFLIGLGPSSHLSAIEAEMQLARESGIQDFIVRSQLPQTAEDRAELISTIDRLLSDDLDTFLLSLELNPDTAWLRDHPTEVVLNDLGLPLRVSVTSESWIKSVASILHSTLNELSNSDLADSFEGLIVRAFTNGEWSNQSGRDRSEVATVKFQQWLETEYGDIKTLQTAWNDESIAKWDDVAITEQLDSNPKNFFHDPSIAIREADYARFIGIQTASQIKRLIDTVSPDESDNLALYAAVGNVLMGTDSDLSEHLRGSGLTGFVTSSIANDLRGISSVPTSEEFSYLYIDSSFTGIEFDATTGAPTVPPGWDASLLRDNLSQSAALSALPNTTWVVGDARGFGSFTHPPIWKDLKTLLELREALLAQTIDQNVRPITLVYEPNSALPVYDSTTMGKIIHHTLGSVLRTGLPLEWKSLEEVVTANPTEPPIYLFLNHFNVSEDRALALREILAMQNATAIWLYAPGYIDTTPSADHISRFTGIKTSKRKDDSSMGSRYAFSGNWIEENATVGEALSIQPSFHTEDEGADPLARYQDTNEVSAAMKFHEDKWTSIVLYDPIMTPDFLRDLLYILAVPLNVISVPQEGDPILVPRGSSIVVYSDEPARTRLELSRPRNVRNLLNTEQGWTNRNEIAISLRAGETKVLSLE